MSSARFPCVAAAIAVLALAIPAQAGSLNQPGAQAEKLKLDAPTERVERRQSGKGDSEAPYFVFQPKDTLVSGWVTKGNDRNFEPNKMIMLGGHKKPLGSPRSPQ